MRKCKNCGSEIEEEIELCPKCGTHPGSVTITDLPQTRLRPIFPKYGDRLETVNCPNCGEEIEELVDLCPKCGTNPGPQTITDLHSVPKEKKKKGQ